MAYFTATGFTIAGKEVFQRAKIVGFGTKVADVFI